MSLTILAGGSAANPFTLGHVQLLKNVREAGVADQIIWIPSGERPDKQLVSPDHRVAMTMLGIPDAWLLTNPKVTVDFSDVYHENTPTIVWIERLHDIYKGADIIWFTGADSVAPRDVYAGKCEIEACWVRGEELMKNHRFLILPRDGYPDPRSLGLADNFQTLDIPTPPEISSSLVRDLIARGSAFDHLVPEGVAKYIQAYELYGYHSVNKETKLPPAPEGKTGRVEYR